MSKYGVISGRYFPVFSPNTVKYGPEMTPYLGTFHAVNVFKNMDSICSVYPRIWTTEAYPGHHDLLVYVIKNEFVKVNPKIRCYSDYKKLQAFKNTIYHGRANVWQYPFKNWQYPEFYFLI